MTNRRAAVVVGAVGAGVVAASAIVTLAGSGIWWLVAATTAVVAFAVASRRGVAIGLAAGVIGVAWLLLAAMIVSAALGIPLVAMAVGVLVVVGLGASVVAAKSTVRMPTSIWQWAPALTGSALWLATVALCRVIPGAARLSWVTSGDSANYVLQARDALAANGIPIGANANPAPFAGALVALSGGGGGSLSHELNALAATWTVSIALSCLLAGVLAASIVGRDRPRLAGVAGAGVSVLPLSWLLGTYAVEYGFLNASVALVLMLASALVAFNAKRVPALALALLLLAAVTMLTTWAPLVVIPGALVLFVAVENRRALWAMPPWAKVLLALPVALAIVYVVGVSQPSYVANQGALAAEGGYFPLSELLWAGVFLVAVGLILTGLRGALRREAAVLAAVVAASAIGVNLLLARSGFVFSYYPQKFLWLAVSLVLVLDVILVVALVARAGLNRSRTLAGFGAIIAVLVAVMLVVPTSKPGYTGRDLVTSMVGSSFAYSSEAITERIVANSSTASPVYLYPSGGNERFLPNLWMLLTHDNTLREFAYEQPATVAELCELVEAFDGPLTIETTDAALEAELADACPSEDVSVVSAN